MKATVEEAPATSEVEVEEGISTSKTSSLADSNSRFTCSILAGDRFVEHFRDGGEKLCSRESISIFSSFSSSRSFNSRTSASSPRTRSSKDSVYPLGNARRLSLSLVLHSKPTLAHCVQHGRMPSQLVRNVSRYDIISWIWKRLTESFYSCNGRTPELSWLAHCFPPLSPS